MASIEQRYNRAGQLMHYRLIVSGGLNWEGKQIKRTTTWKPPRPNMSKKQMEREAMAAAFKFEEAIQAGYDIDKVKRFCDYADYVLDLKERNVLAPTTIEQYRAMLPRINDAIGHLKLTQIRPQHLNDFYISCRMQEANRLLGEGLSVTQVSDHMGYSSIHSFSRSYKNHFGVNPSVRTE